MKSVAVVVTFEPDLSSLNMLVSELMPQVSNLVVVDNNSPVDVKSSIINHVQTDFYFIKLESNFGIAYAQNIGIQFAIDQKADYVLLMDQDSVPEPDMVQKLQFALLEAASDSSNAPVAAAGPVYIDRRSGTNSFFVIERNGYPSRWHPKYDLSEYAPINVSFLISSGTLIPLDVLRKIGGKRSNYFIDHVDTEWSFRARAEGFRLLGVPQAKMNHTLGDKVSKVWFFGIRHVAHHSPLRDYYMFRNTILMIRDVKMTAAWQLHLIWRLFQFAGFFLIFAPHRYTRFCSMFLGIKHGLLGISGKVDLKTAVCSNIPKSSLDI